MFSLCTNNLFGTGMTYREPLYVSKEQDAPWCSVSLFFLLQEPCLFQCRLTKHAFWHGVSINEIWCLCTLSVIKMALPPNVWRYLYKQIQPNGKWNVQLCLCVCVSGGSWNPVCDTECSVPVLDWATGILVQAQELNMRLFEGKGERHDAKLFP